MKLFDWIARKLSRTKPIAASQAVPEVECSEDDVSHATLHILWDEGLNCSLSSSLEECNKVSANIARCRIKYANCQPIRVRHHIFDWLNYFERRVNVIRKDHLDKQHKAECLKAIQSKFSL